MPNPIELIMNPLSMVFIVIFTALVAWESLFPARRLPYAKNWRVRGLLAFGVYFFLSSYLPLIWDNSLAKWQLFELTRLSTISQFFLGFLIFEFVLYCWHRALHSSNILWRTFHQMHHSAERLDTFGAFWLSPMDMLGFTFTGSIALVLIVGIDANVATAIMFVSFFFAIFQHMNIRTPQWLGYLVQRPESHSYHHAMGIHRNNYADIPLFDLLLGTFTNPRVALESGFYPGASERVIDMLLFRDIYEQNENELTIQTTSGEVARGEVA